MEVETTAAPSECPCLATDIVAASQRAHVEGSVVASHLPHLHVHLVRLLGQPQTTVHEPVARMPLHGLYPVGVRCLRHRGCLAK